jgi:hypothetical protein
VARAQPAGRSPAGRFQQRLKLVKAIAERFELKTRRREDVATTLADRDVRQWHQRLDPRDDELVAGAAVQPAAQLTRGSLPSRVRPAKIRLARRSESW